MCERSVLQSLSLLLSSDLQGILYCGLSTHTHGIASCFFSSAGEELQWLPSCEDCQLYWFECSTKPQPEIQPRSLQWWASLLPFGRICNFIMSQVLLLQLCYIKNSALQEYNMKIPCLLVMQKMKVGIPR